MKTYLLPSLLFALNVNADPFFGEETNNTDAIEQVETDSAKDIEKITACKPSENQYSLNLPTEFDKLKLVGLVKIGDDFRALFTDEHDQLFDLKERELVNNQEIEIKNINLKSVTYINWKLTQDCNSPYEVTLKL